MAAARSLKDETVAGFVRTLKANIAKKSSEGFFEHSVKIAKSERLSVSENKDMCKILMDSILDLAIQETLRVTIQVGIHQYLLNLRDSIELINELIDDNWDLTVWLTWFA